MIEKLKSLKPETEVNPILERFYEKYDMQVVETRIVRDTGSMADAMSKKERKKRERKEKKEAKAREKAKEKEKDKKEKEEKDKEKVKKDKKDKMSTIEKFCTLRIKPKRQDSTAKV